MRSSEARVRNPLADAGRRTSKTLKFRLGKQVPPLCPSSAGEAPDKPQSSLLYHQQLWAASGHIPQRLTCDRQLYYPELAVAAPVVKQLPVDSAIDVHQGKRAKLAGGQYRRSFREAASACDSTPPGTPYIPNRQQLHVIEDRGQCSVLATTSSSSSHDLSMPRRQSSCAALADRDVADAAWPFTVPTKQKRSSRVRRVQWQQWPPVLQQLDAAPGSVDAAAAPQQQQLHTQQQLLALQQQQQQQLLLGAKPVLQQGAVAAWQQQQDLRQPPPSAAACMFQPPPAAGTPLHKAAVQEIAAAFPSAASVACSKAAAAAAKAAAVAGGDISPGQETSQLSDMTMCRESPRDVTGVALSSWPSSSTESDCQVQPQQSRDAREAAAACKRPFVGSSVSPVSPSSPLHEVF